MAATITEVAKHSGLSVATVSRVLNHSANVSEESRLRVLRSIEELDYSPNMLGSNLRKMRSGQILVLVPTINNPFYSTVIEGVQNVAQIRGYRVLVANTYSDSEQLRQYVQLLRQRLVDGLIILHPVMETLELGNIGRHYPIVQCSEFDTRVKHPYVGIDDRSATKMAAMHLVSMGRKKIAMLNSDLRFGYARRRQEGFERTLEEAGIPVRRDWIKYAIEIHFDRAVAVATELLSGEEYPDAIFCVSDVYAAACIKAARQRGLRIPEDVAIVGFDNIDISMMTDPPITTVNQPMLQLGSEACKMLLTRIDQPEIELSNMLLPADLIVRQSTLGHNY